MSLTNLEVVLFPVVAVIVYGPGGDEALGVTRDQVTARLKGHAQNRLTGRLKQTENGLMRATDIYAMQRDLLSHKNKSVYNIHT